MGSLYEYIASSVVDGELPEGFSLPELTDGENEIKWADGAFDGVIMYHMGAAEVSKNDRTLISDAVRAAAARDYELADQLFIMLGNQTRAITIIDDLQSYIVEKKHALDPNNLYEYAIHLLFETDDRECLKFALSILELFETDTHEDLKSAIRTIGLSDEFALFAIFVMLHWKDGNDEIWNLAQKIHGWGRIHAIEHIEPDSEEIRSWLLTEGVHNSVMSAYSALTCWTKSDAEAVLNDQPTYEQFAGIRDIIKGLLDEGPVQGLSAIENADDVIGRFLDIAQSMPLVLGDYEVIYAIWSYYREEVSGKCEIAMICRKLLHTYNCRCLILDAVKQGDCIDMAIDTGVDCKPYIMQLLKTSFEEKYFLCNYLMHDASYKDETLEIFRENLPLEDMKTEPTLTLGLGNEYWRQSALEFLMQELRQYPYEGQDFIETGLRSAPVRTRNGALYVLEHWVTEESKSLAVVLPHFYELLSDLKEIEPDDKVRARMDQLLSGATAFKEEVVDADDLDDID